MSMVKSPISRVASYLLELREHLLSIPLSMSKTVHGVVDNEVISAKLIDDIRVAFAPKLGEVLPDDLEILCLFLSRHRVDGRRWLQVEALV